MSFVRSNINELKDSIVRSGLAYSNRYEVLISVPSGFRMSNAADMKNMMIRCDSILIPGRALSTAPYRYYGPARNMPYEPIYAGEMTLSMVLSSDLRERKFFEDWMDLICSKTNYKFGYYDDYVSQIQITVLTKNDFPTYRFYVEEVYPKSIGDLQVGYDKENDYLRQDITLSFRKYTPEYLGISDESKSAVPVQWARSRELLQRANQPPQNAIPAPPPPQRSAEQFLVSRGGQIYRMGYDGTVNGIYDPQKYQEILNSPR